MSELPGEGSHPLHHQLGVDRCLNHSDRPSQGAAHRAHRGQVGQASLLLQLLLHFRACHVSVRQGSISLPNLVRGQWIGWRRVSVLVVVGVVEVETDKLVAVHGGGHLERGLGIGGSRDGWEGGKGGLAGLRRVGVPQAGDGGEDGGAVVVLRVPHPHALAVHHTVDRCQQVAVHIEVPGSSSDQRLVLSVP